jgi:excinuclease ABC subunit A
LIRSWKVPAASTDAPERQPDEGSERRFSGLIDSGLGDLQSARWQDTVLLGELIEQTKAPCADESFAKPASILGSAVWLRRDMSRDGFVCVRGAREHNLKSIDVDIPRDALVVFTGISGSGKSSLAFGTLYAEAQRRYLESVSPYARRLFHQLSVPDVDRIDGLPPAVALQQQRGTPTTRSSVGSVSTISNLLRMLYSRAGLYPKGQPMLYAESFSYNRVEGACPSCHGQGRIYEVTEQSMVPNPVLTIRERAVAAWPTAWQGQNLRDILVTLGYDVDRPWKDLPKKDRDWILFTDEQRTVPVYAGLTPAESRRALREKWEPSYQGTFTSARRYVMETFTKSHSAMMKKRVSAFMRSQECSLCHDQRLRSDALAVTFAGLNITELANQSLKATPSLLASYASSKVFDKTHTQEKIETAKTITKDIVARLDALVDLGVNATGPARYRARVSSNSASLFIRLVEACRLGAHCGGQFF